MALPLKLLTYKDVEALYKFRKRYPDSKRTFIAYKYVVKSNDPELNRISPLYNAPGQRLQYLKGTTLCVNRYNKSEHKECASGINVATKIWASLTKQLYTDRSRNRYYSIVNLEVAVCDVVAIPFTCHFPVSCHSPVWIHEKIRCKRVKVLS